MAYDAKGCPACGASRRAVLRLGASCGAALLLPAPVLAEASPVNGPLGPYSPRARRLVETTQVVDMLCGVRRALVDPGGDNAMPAVTARFASWFQNPELVTREGLARYLSSGIDVFQGSPDLAQMLPQIATPFDRAQFLLDGWARIFAAHPDLFAPILKPADFAPRRTHRKLAIILGLQNGDQFRTTADVAMFYGKGLRLSQLTYNGENALGGGAFAKAGLTDYGREVIRAMNAVGMVVDLSHANDETTRAGVDASAVTPIISHTNCRALNPGFTRAMPDDILKQVAGRGGVIGFTVVRNFVSGHEPVTTDDYIRHIDHAVQLVGIDHVGIGSDTDLTPQDGVDDKAKQQYLSTRKDDSAYQWRQRLGIDGLDHNRRVYDIAEQLIRRGYTDGAIRKVLGENWVRVLSRIWRTRVPA